MDQLNLWDHEAKRALVTRFPTWWTYYLGSSYRKATEIALGYVSTDMSRIRLLKTDLWNEGVETRRDILGDYQQNARFELCGVDVSPIVCRRAQMRLSKTHVAQANIASLPFRDESFDVVLDLSVLDHVPASQVPTVIAEYARLGKRGGIVLLIYWYRSGLWKLTSAFRRSMYGDKSAEERATQHHHDRNMVSREMRRHYDTIREFCVLTLLVTHGTVGLARATEMLKNILPIRVYRLVTELEYSGVSKYLLQNFGALHAIVGKKR